MELNLKRPLVFFDIESTGLDIATDRIVEISVVKLYPVDGNHPAGTYDVKTRRINPEMHIPEEASAIHHITDEDVKDCPTFKQYAKSLANYLEGCDIAGYNSINFDIPLLAEEFERCGVSFDFRKALFVDVQNIFHKMEERTLSAAYRFYCNKNLEDAHTAEADTVATMEVLKAQLERYSSVLENDVKKLAEFSHKNNRFDLAGKMVLNPEGKPIFNFGKHKGKLVAEVLAKEPSYYDWMMQGSFTADTKRNLTEIKLHPEKYR
ncbi:MAG: 3'-5' exonuclease [Bacteroidales bacterium]|nr:3'-5' exonuclease [Bacteroidales bacterium]